MHLTGFAVREAETASRGAAARTACAPRGWRPQGARGEARHAHLRPHRWWPLAWLSGRRRHEHLARRLGPSLEWGRPARCDDRVRWLSRRFDRFAGPLG